MVFHIFDTVMQWFMLRAYIGLLRLVPIFSDFKEI